MAKRKLTSFERQFVANRRAGKKEFTFGGKSYSTKQKGEGGGSRVAVAGAKKQTLPSKGPIPKSRYPMGSRENPRVVADKPKTKQEWWQNEEEVPLERKGPKRGTPNVPTPTPKPTISTITGRPVPVDKPRERKPDAAVTTSTTPNTPKVPTPAAQGVGDIYRIVDKNRTNPPPATAGNAAAVAKFNTAAGRGRVAAGTPFPKAPARKAAGTPLPPTPLRKAAGTPTPGPYAGARTPRGDAQRAEFLATEKRNIGDAMRPKPAVAATVTTPKTSRIAMKAPSPDRFGGAITTAKTDRPKKKTVRVAGR